MIKKITLFSLLIAINLIPIVAKAENTVKLTFNIKTLNTKEGYDYISKLVIFCDRKIIGESPHKKQTEPSTYSVEISKGNHEIYAVFCALYNGNWENRIKLKNYSFDADFFKIGDWNKDVIIDMTFDMKEEKKFIDFKEVNQSNSNIDNIRSSSDTYSSTAPKYKKQLDKLNEYLKTFDNGYYGHFEVSDDYVREIFKSGKYIYFRMEDIEGAEIQEKNNRVILKCKGNNNCISSITSLSGPSEYTQFVTTGTYYFKELADLLNNFRDAYLGKILTIEKTAKNTTNNTTNDSSNEKERTNRTNSNSSSTYNNVATTKLNYEIVANQPYNFKEGDKVLIEFETLDGNTTQDENVKYKGKTGTVIYLDYNDLSETFEGEIKMDSNNKVVYFVDIVPKLIKIK